MTTCLTALSTETATGGLLTLMERLSIVVDRCSHLTLSLKHITILALAYLSSKKDYKSTIKWEVQRMQCN
jgi:hypothetical protein